LSGLNLCNGISNFSKATLTRASGQHPDRLEPGTHLFFGYSS
jgi:hypothetical protein